MKKIICALLSLIILCSCSSESSIRVVNKNLSFKAHILYFGKEYDFFCEIDNNMKTVFTVEGGLINGFTAEYDREEIRLFMEGIERKEECSILSDSVFTLLFQIFDYFESNEYKVEKNDKVYTVSGKTENGDFSLLVSPAGLPISVELKEASFSAEFYDVTLKK